MRFTNKSGMTTIIWKINHGTLNTMHWKISLVPELMWLTNQSKKLTTTLRKVSGVLQKIWVNNQSCPLTTFLWQISWTLMLPLMRFINQSGMTNIIWKISRGTLNTMLWKISRVLELICLNGQSKKLTMFLKVSCVQQLIWRNNQSWILTILLWEINWTL